MRIMICDYQIDLERNLEYEKELLLSAFPDAEISIFMYSEDRKTDFLALLKDTDAVINTYAPFDREVLSACGKMKCIALNSMGLDTVDIQAATEFGIMVCPVAEYCTDEVAEHTVALIFALSRGLKLYTRDIEKHIWNYQSAGKLRRLRGQTMTIFGFGHIGRAVAARSQGMGIHVQVVSHSLGDYEAQELGVVKVDWKTAMKSSDIISNHLSFNRQTAGYFDLGKFKCAEKSPLFINTGRGGTVVQEDLIKALDLGYLRGAGLDVLEAENTDLSKLALLGRDNVILTPHAAFYSIQSAKELQRISCANVICALTGRYDQITKLANPTAAGRR